MNSSTDMNLNDAIRQRDYYQDLARKAVKAKDAYKEENDQLRETLKQKNEEQLKQAKDHAQLQEEYDRLKAAYDRLRKQVFGRSSEQTHRSHSGNVQLWWDTNGNIIIPEIEESKNELTDEEIKKNESEEKEDSEDEPVKIITVKEHKRRVKKRKKRGVSSTHYLPEDTPVIPRVIEVPEEDRTCPECGAELQTLKYQTADRIGLQPVQPVLYRDMRQVAVCRQCGHNNAIKVPIVYAPLPTHAIPNSFADETLLAQVFVWKYGYGLPYYRIEGMLESSNIKVLRSTMANWAIYVTEHWLVEFVQVLKRAILEGPVVHMDETSCTVLKEPGRSPSTKSWMLALRSGEFCDNSLVVFDYVPNKNQKVINKKINGYEGTLLTDGLQIYEDLPDGVTHACCWAHTRREWYTAAAAFLYPESDEPQPLSKIILRDDGADLITISLAVKKVTASVIGFAYCQKLFDIEDRFRDRSTAERLKARQTETRPLLESFHKWLENQPECETATGKARQYTLKRWEELTVFLDDGMVPVDNNAIERTIRPYTTVRKNALFCDTQAGARAEAAIYSIMQTANESGLDLYKYTLLLLNTLPALEDAVRRDIADAERRVKEDFERIFKENPSMTSKELDNKIHALLAAEAVQKPADVGAKRHSIDPTEIEMCLKEDYKKLLEEHPDLAEDLDDDIKAMLDADALRNMGEVKKPAAGKDAWKSDAVNLSSASKEQNAAAEARSDTPQNMGEAKKPAAGEDAWKSNAVNLSSASKEQNAAAEAQDIDKIKEPAANEDAQKLNENNTPLTQEEIDARKEYLRKKRIERVYDQHYACLLPNNVPDDIRRSELVPINNISASKVLKENIVLGRINTAFSRWHIAPEEEREKLASSIRADLQALFTILQGDDSDRAPHDAVSQA